MNTDLAGDIGQGLNSLVDLVCMVDSDGVILYTNEASMRLLGYDAQEMIGQSILNFVEPIDLSKSARALRELAREHERSYFNNRLRTKDGHGVEVEWFISWTEGRDIIFGIGKNLSVINEAGANQKEPAAETSLFRDVELFRGIDQQDLQLMEEHSEQRFVPRREILRFPQFSNRYAYLLSSGVMKTITADEQGNDLIKYLVKPGQLVGDIPLLEQYERPNNFAEALQDSMVTLLDMSILNEWLRRYDAFRIRLKQQVALRIHQIEDRLLAVTHKTTYQRVSEFIVNFVLDFGSSTGGGWTVENFLTHTDIAQLCSVSRPKVSQVLSSLKSQGVIAYDTEWITVGAASPLLAARGLLKLR